MEDRQELALEQYDFQVKNRRRARGAVLLDTNEGLRLMREYTSITSHFAFENEVKEHLRLQGMKQLDWAVKNNGSLYVRQESSTWSMNGMRERTATTRAVRG